MAIRNQWVGKVGRVNTLIVGCNYEKIMDKSSSGMLGESSDKDFYK